MKDIDETEATVSMPDEALRCRGGQHDFPLFDEYLDRVVRVINRGGLSVEVTDDCRRKCGVSRKIEFALPTMAVVKRSLVYPKNEEGHDTYLLPKHLRGTGWLSREEIRRAQVARALQARRAADSAKRRERARAAEKLSADPPVEESKVNG